MQTLSLSAIATSLFVAQACAHTWIEQLAVISTNGSYVGNYGYPRNYLARTDPGFSGDKAQYLLPTAESGRTRINSQDLLCRDSQRKQTQSEKWPRLNVAPGGYVAMKYAENGHVSLPDNQIGKPEKGGTVFIYGTLEPKDDEKIMDVLKWTTDGSGGDKRGKLLTSQNYDDNRCYQINSSPISTKRQKEFPDPIPGQPGTNNEQYCETDVQIPKDLTNGKYALYWVWQWPTAPNMDPGLPDGKDEWYTTCSDVNVVSNAAKVKTFAANSEQQQYKLEQQDPQSTAPGWFKERTALTTDVWKGMVVSTSSGSSPAPAATTPSTSDASTPSSVASSAPLKSTPAAGNGEAGGDNAGPATVTVTMTGSPAPAATEYITQILTVTAGAEATAAAAAATPASSNTTVAAPTLKSRIVGRRPQPLPGVPFIGAEMQASSSSSSSPDGAGMSYLHPVAPPAASSSTGACDAAACVDASQKAKASMTPYVDHDGEEQKKSSAAAARAAFPSTLVVLAVVAAAAVLV